jgi:GNAT superfamily N-acetyltransferase
MSRSVSQGAAEVGSKLVSAEQALAVIRPGSRIFLGTGCAAPRKLLATLEAMSPGPADLEFVSFVTTSAAPEWQGAGLGTALQNRLQDYAVSRGVRGFIAEILPDNTPMLRLARRLSGNVTTSRDEDVVHVSILFADWVDAGQKSSEGAD